MRLPILILMTLAVLTTHSFAHAQCTSNASSCVTCHEAQGEHAVLQSAQPWHIDHGFGDLCASCHGGDPAATTIESAHVGLRHPLEDPIRSCGGCHTAEANTRAERYRTASTSVVAERAPPPPTPAASASKMDLFLAAIAAAQAIALYALIRRRRGVPRRSALDWLRAVRWSPYQAGALLGLVVAISEVFCGRPLAASGAFDKLAAYLGRWLFPDSQYYGHVMAPGITWQVWLVVGVLAGSFVSSRLSGEARIRWFPETQWESRFGGSRLLRLAIAFIGAVLVQFGAGIAGGCTSGLAISGGAALSPAAFIFMAGMFAGGIPTAWLWYRGRRE